VLPSVADRLGVSRYAGRDVFDLPAVPRTVVVLVDGLGHDLLLQRSGHAPFLRSHLASARRVPCGFPTTTATSMGSLGTGLLPGAHGLVGMQVLDPDTDRLVNELSWEDGPDPVRWQPNETVFETLEDAGVAVTMVGPWYFKGSGLTTAALRGGGFRSGRTLDDRVDAGASAVREAKRSLVYLYWGEVDKIGHVHGCQSWQWGDEVEAVDAALARLAARVPDDTSIVITADHGMVDVPFEARVDLALEPELMHGIRHLGGEPRCLQLYTEAGERDAVESLWRSRLRGSATVHTREQLLDAGWFGPVRREVEPRIGDLVVITAPSFAVVHSGLMRPEIVRLLGLHGSTSQAELAVPVIVVPPRRGA
jgi:predicted AlkP superfamily pyrophosphatase or phosphodiesterase